MQKYTVVVDDEGTIRWHKEGTEILHREDGPAVEWFDGRKSWYQNNKRHRLDGPAIEYNSGTKFWYQNDELHRLDGPAIEYNSGIKFWYQNNELHRLDGPAVEWFDGNKLWYQNGKLHRLNGPAKEYAYNTKIWYIEGINYSEEKYLKKIKELNQQKECFDNATIDQLLNLAEDLADYITNGSVDIERWKKELEPRMKTLVWKVDK